MILSELILLKNLDLHILVNFLSVVSTAFCMSGGQKEDGVRVLTPLSHLAHLGQIGSAWYGDELMWNWREKTRKAKTSQKDTLEIDTFLASYAT